jgi:N6-L-threonylcarbamoyladenine synthase
MKTLGIETSCDETSLAILDDGRIVINEIYTQEAHTAFGGVVPEIASRAHIEKIDALCRTAFGKAELRPSDIDLIAVTDRPGLAGALLVGISFALGLHCGNGIPITGVNHLEGHICSIFLEYPDLDLPFLALIVSGGHTSIYKVDDFGAYACLGQTVDDAAGEAFDKIGKLLGFTYPAGRSIEQEAALASGAPLISFPVARMSASRLDFSFSGLKTAVKYHLLEKGPRYINDNRPLICASFQKTTVDALVNNARDASRQTGIRTIAVVGGVACNKYLRTRMNEAFGHHVFFPSPSLCTDNAAMIARAGYERGRRSMLRVPHMAPSAELQRED